MRATHRLGFASVLLGFLGASVFAVACAGRSDKTAGDQAAETAKASCSAEQQFTNFNKMIAQPIVPPRMFGGIDLANGDAWSGLTLEDAERTLCPSNPIVVDAEADKDPNAPTAEVGWGVAPNFQVVVDYEKATRKIDFYQLNAGYQGTLDFASRPTSLSDPSKPNPAGQHKYSIGVGRPILRDGQPWLLNWSNACGAGDPPCLDAQSTELFDALMFTFAPELTSTQVSCRMAATCLARDMGEEGAVFGARPLGIYFHVPSASAPQPGASTPDYLYGFLVKQMPFSAAEMSLKLDDEGPVATAPNLGDRSPQASCSMKLGMPFQSFLDGCVEVVADPARDDLLKLKLLGNAQRAVVTAGSTATGTWLLDVAGVRPNFSSERFDETSPSATAHATEIALDIRSTGKVKNEWSADGATLTLAGTAAVYREYARLVQDFLHAQMDPKLPRFGLGAAECLLSGDAATWHPAQGCTGMEQLVTPADASTTTDAGIKRVSLGAAAARSLGYQTVLTPGNPLAVFCADPDKLEHCGYEDPASGMLGFNASLWDGTRQRVIAILGAGQESAVPAPARDRQVYLRFWTKALVKYLRAAPQSPTDLSLPAFDALTPADGDITIEAGPNDLATVKYLNKLQYNLLVQAGNVQTITFR